MCAYIYIYIYIYIGTCIHTYMVNVFCICSRLYCIMVH